MKELFVAYNFEYAKENVKWWNGKICPSIYITVRRLTTASLQKVSTIQIPNNTQQP